MNQINITTHDQIGQTAKVAGFRFESYSDASNMVTFAKGTIARKTTKVIITYVPGLDLYTVRVFVMTGWRKGFEVLRDETFEGVYADSLANFFL